MDTASFDHNQLALVQRMLDNLSGASLEQTDLLNPKVQSLYRLNALYLKTYMQFKNHLDKSDPKPRRGGPPPHLPPRWLADPAAFAEQALGVKLYDHQKKLCLADKRVNLLIAGRGAGKSTAACVKAIHQAVTREQHTVLVVSSGQRMSSGFGDKILDLVRGTDIRPWVKSAAGELVRFTNGSVIRFLPSNPDTIRGYHPKSAKAKFGITVILDEACFMDQGDEIRKAVEYAIITTHRNDGRLYIVSSPSSTRSWVYQLARNRESDTEVIQCASTANPDIPPEEIERLRREKNELEFRAEVLGEWVDGAFGLFTNVVDPAVVDPAGAPLPERTLYSLGADLALSYSPTHDSNVLAVLGKWWPDDHPDTEPRYRAVEMRVLDRASDKEIRQVAKELIESYRLFDAGIEQYQGKSLAEYCQRFGVRAQLIAPTAGLQRTIFHEMHRLLRRNLLELSRDLPDRFFDELNAFEYHRDESGRIGFGHPGRGHDDTVYALAWALHAALAIDRPPQPLPFLNPILTVPKVYRL